LTIDFFFPKLVEMERLSFAGYSVGKFAFRMRFGAPGRGCRRAYVPPPHLYSTGNEQL